MNTKGNQGKANRQSDAVRKARRAANKARRLQKMWDDRLETQRILAGNYTYEEFLQRMGK
jgi:hypothetical protein